MKHAACTVLQITLLAGLSQLGFWAVARFDFPLPGNLLGMLMLLGLLASGILPLKWIDAGASLLLAHLAFFFVPIAVGLMGFADLLQRQGPALLAVLVLAAAVGIVAAGLVTQFLGRFRAAAGG